MSTGSSWRQGFVELVNELQDELGLQRLTMEFAARNGEVVAPNGMARAKALATPAGCRPQPAPASITRAIAAARTRLGSYGNASIDQWDQAFIRGSDEVERKKGVRVSPHFVKAMMEVETGGNGNYPPDRCRPSDGTDNVPACGPMQIKWPYHFHRCGDCNRNTVEGQVEMAFHILGDTKLARGRDEYDAFLIAYFTTTDIGTGTTQKMYVDRIRQLTAIMDRDLAGEEPEPEPEPGPGTNVTQQDILNLISNHAPGVHISFGFNERNVGNPIYSYGTGHGTNGDEMHSGMDIAIPDEHPISCVFGGEVLCVGTEGANIWGEGCGYFSDDDGGIGRITILTNAEVMVKGKKRQIKMTYGHMSSSLVRVGETVTDGQRIGRSGSGGEFPHLHWDVVVAEDFEGELNNPAIWNNPGQYHLLEPMSATLNAMDGSPVPVIYPPPLDVPQPAAMDHFATVFVTQDDLPVFQRASRNAPETGPRLKKGDEFLGAMQIWGADGDEPFWITSNNNRVPVKGTRSDDWNVDQ